MAAAALEQESGQVDQAPNPTWLRKVIALQTSRKHPLRILNEAVDLLGMALRHARMLHNKYIHEIAQNVLLILNLEEVRGKLT